MKITIDIKDTNNLTFEELRDAVATSLEENGIDASDENCTITEDETTGDPNELEDEPLESEAPAAPPMPTPAPPPTR